MANALTAIGNARAAERTNKLERVIDVSPLQMVPEVARHRGGCPSRDSTSGNSVGRPASQAILHPDQPLPHMFAARLQHRRLAPQSSGPNRLEFLTRSAFFCCCGW